MLPPFGDTAPASLRTATGCAFGRCREPIADPSLGRPRFASSLRAKQWHEHSLVTDEWFVAVTLAQLGYVALGILRSDFVQPRGSYHGRVRPESAEPVKREGVFGVAENHDAMG
jgi:hypothetical protein